MVVQVMNDGDAPIHLVVVHVELFTRVADSVNALVALVRSGQCWKVVFVNAKLKQSVIVQTIPFAFLLHFVSVNVPPAKHKVRVSATFVLVASVQPTPPLLKVIGVAHSLIDITSEMLKLLNATEYGEASR